MDEGTVRGIHQADDAVVDAAREIGGQIGDLVTAR